MKARRLSTTSLYLWILFPGYASFFSLIAIKLLVSSDQLVAWKTWTEPVFKFTALSRAYAQTGSPLILQYWATICLLPILLATYLFIFYSARKKYGQTRSVVLDNDAVWKGTVVMGLAAFLLFGTTATYVPHSGIERFAVLTSPVFGPFYFAVFMFCIIFFAVLPCLWLYNLLFKRTF